MNAALAAEPDIFRQLSKPIIAVYAPKLFSFELGLYQRQAFQVGVQQEIYVLFIPFDPADQLPGIL